MPNFIELTINSETKILINLSMVASIVRETVWNKDRTKRIEQGSAIYFADTEGHCTVVLECYEDIKAIIKQQKKEAK